MMSEAVRIQTPEDLASFLARIRGESLLAVDTEAASFHRYHDRVYLLQLSTRTLSAIIDPLAVTDLSPLGRVLENPNLEVIFHDADYDLRLLDRQYQFRMHHIFDTRIAAQFLNEPGIGLAALLQKHFQVQLDKQYQRADWSIRPLSAEMIDYAVADTQYLPALRDILREQLILQSRLGWVEEECALVTGVRSGPSPDRMDAFLNVKGARGLDPRGLAVLREVYRWRETSAAAIDRASFRILGNEALIALAERRPASILEMEQIRGVGRELIARRGGELLAAIVRGQSLAEEDLPRFERRPRSVPDLAYENRLDRLKMFRNKLAVTLDLAPGVLCPNGTLEAVARANPESTGTLGALTELRRWQIEVFGEDLVRTSRGVNTP